jgi:hypothetical protein
MLATQSEGGTQKFSRRAGLAEVEEVAGAAEDVLLSLDPPHALSTSTAIVP